LFYDDKHVFLLLSFIHNFKNSIFVYLHNWYYHECCGNINDLVSVISTDVRSGEIFFNSKNRFLDSASSARNDDVEIFSTLPKAIGKG